MEIAAGLIASDVGEALGNDEEEVLLAISRLGNQASAYAVFGAVRGRLVNEAAGPIGAALRMLEGRGLISRAAKDAALSEGDVRYLVTAEGNRILADKEGDLAFGFSWILELRAIIGSYGPSGTPNIKGHSGLGLGRMVGVFGPAAARFGPGRGDGDDGLVYFLVTLA